MRSWFWPLGPMVVHFGTHSTVLSYCWNNLSLCALADTCRMRDAVRMMESRICHEDPTTFLMEQLAFNLCMLYGMNWAPMWLPAYERSAFCKPLCKQFYLQYIGREN